MKAFVFSVVVCLLISSIASADTFGTGANQFEIDFVNISGDSGDLGRWSAGPGYPFSGVNHGDYRMGKYEITNDQFAKFASNSNVYWTGADVPSNNVSWLEAAQFVNYLNTSTGNPAAYKFSGSTFTMWDVTDTGYDASNPFRNSNAKYFLPTENEWIKAAYWNGTNLQLWATPDNTQPLEDIEANYGYEYSAQPWNVGSGSEELNGTFDMMGNVYEWMESPYLSGVYWSDFNRGIRGGCFANIGRYLSASDRDAYYLGNEGDGIGFRVASIPEPGTVSLLALGGLALLGKRK